ncbi:TRASH domain-containing protein [Vulcanisaeta souniana]|uniref:Transcriptional regulator n=1 Tax=Vulcanisaeta souniana JCM 11219 TaxID=1293586 RepID=A0A830E617_9CREN|nr:TRASH domain-containing protein [Vulcanisaeta souniana]BDR91493.1 transcriptional regulator [Vulcanisaeta souniana JCM 11219]GGI73611.1 transcriptional regulator [Vulcanisaeta souniana JCM 11219]
MGKLRSNIGSGDKLVCENCGAELTPERIYVHEINGAKHYFCCEHCAHEFERKLRIAH